MVRIEHLRTLLETYPEVFRKANQIGVKDYSAGYSLDYHHGEFAAELPALLDWIEKAHKYLTEQLDLGDYTLAQMDDLKELLAQVEVK